MKKVSVSFFNELNRSKQGFYFYAHLLPSIAIGTNHSYNKSLCYYKVVLTFLFFSMAVVYSIDNTKKEKV